MSIQDISPDKAREYIVVISRFKMLTKSEESRQMKKITIARDLKLIDFNALTNFAGAMFPFNAPGTGDDKGEYARLQRRRIMCDYVNAACDAYTQRRGMYPMAVDTVLKMLKDLENDND